MKLSARGAFQLIFSMLHCKHVIRMKFSANPVKNFTLSLELKSPLSQRGKLGALLLSNLYKRLENSDDALYFFRKDLRIDFHVDIFDHGVFRAFLERS